CVVTAAMRCAAFIGSAAIQSSLRCASGFVVIAMFGPTSTWRGPFDNPSPFASWPFDKLRVTIVKDKAVTATAKDRTAVRILIAEHARSEELRSEARALGLLRTTAKFVLRHRVPKRRAQMHQTPGHRDCAFPRNR